MPHLRIETNVKSSSINLEAALKELSAAMAETAGKPESRVVVHVVPDQAMMYGGSSDPCGNAYFACISKMGVEENKQHAAKLYPLFDKLFGIKNDRIYIFFQEAERYQIGYKGATLQS